MKADTQTEAEVKALTEDVWNRYARKDLERILERRTTDPDLIVLGVGAGARQICVGRQAWRDALRNQLERVRDARVTIDWFGVSAAGDVAWSPANVTVEATVEGDRVALPTHQTIICERRCGTWRLTQAHFSRPTG